MKNRATIRMGATRWTVTVKGVDGPVTFNLFAMDKTQRRNFTKQFVQAFRAS